LAAAKNGSHSLNCHTKAWKFTRAARDVIEHA
jgi:hypothetical protein